ncbi:mucin-15 [Microcaecilia unicolor]|uniref:Mucin-15 n=1 Tax=Microcaecilia unicolor TaxID=1415580 RepID=A0A6P7XVM6_9AMPH|nr:mucin-15 [Microcaecilia unicolor]
MVSTMPCAFGILSFLLLGNFQWMSAYGEKSTAVSITHTSTESYHHATSTAMATASSPGILDSAITTRTNTTSSRTNNETIVDVTEPTNVYNLTIRISTNISTNKYVPHQSTPPPSSENTTGISNWTSSHFLTDVTSPGITNLSSTSNPAISNVTSYTSTDSPSNGTLSAVTSWPTNSTISISGNSSASTQNSTASSAVATTNSKNTTHISETTRTVSSHTLESSTTLISTPQATTQINNSSEDSQGKEKDSHSSTGVILGAIIGSILGVVLVSVVAYFLCVRKKPESFVHRRLYEDIRNEPVLRLDNTVDPYDLSYGHSAFHNPVADDESPHHHRRSRDFIPMGDMP